MKEEEKELGRMDQRRAWIKDNGKRQEMKEDKDKLGKTNGKGTGRYEN